MFARPGSDVNFLPSSSSDADVIGAEAQPAKRALQTTPVSRSNSFISLRLRTNLIEPDPEEFRLRQLPIHRWSPPTMIRCHHNTLLLASRMPCARGPLPVEPESSAFR